MFIHELGKHFEDCTAGELRQIGWHVGGAMDAESADEPQIDPREALAAE